MKAETFINAVGMIDERHLDIEIQKKAIVYRKWKKRIISFTAAAALIACPLPVLTAFGVAPAYNALYNIAPSVAQTFKPVQRSCEDKGIEMTVISAQCSGNEASIYLAMHDTTGTCPYGEWDLYDSYRINVPRDMIGNCSFSEYDPDTHTAYFVVHLETMDGSTMPEGKVTFSVRELLLGKIHSEGLLEDIDMSSIPYEPETETRTEVSGKNYCDEEPMPEQFRFLVPEETPLCTPLSGISVLNVGYIDGALHILTKYEDNPHTDDHGFISVIDKSGRIVGEETEISFTYWDETHTDIYTEQIIPVSYDALAECALKGEFVTAQDHISGDWEITFPLE